jgi:hypothetical protein
MKRLSAWLGITAVLGGCAITGHLYPVQGPLAGPGTLPIFNVTKQDGAFPTGAIEVQLANGNDCQGELGFVAQSDPTARQMAAEWDSVYGSGYFVANVLGRSTFARSALACTNGDRLGLEYLLLDGNTARGVARDGAGNVFKLTF